MSDIYFDDRGQWHSTPSPPNLIGGDFLARYDAWRRERERYSLRDGMPDGPTADEWHANDDEAVELLHEAAQLIRAAPILGRLPEQKGTG